MRVLALKIGVQNDLRHGRQQRRRQDRPELGFLAAAMGPGSLLQGLHEGIIDAAHLQVSHGVMPLLIAMRSTVRGPFPDSGMVGSAALHEVVSQATKNHGDLTASSAGALCACNTVGRPLE